MSFMLNVINAECHFVECHILVVMLNVVTLNVIYAECCLFLVKLTAVMLSVVILNVMAPCTV